MDVSLVLRALFWFNLAITPAISKDESSIDHGNRLIIAHGLLENEFNGSQPLATNRIVAGTAVAQGTIPGLGLIMHSQNGLISMGTLITPNYVLTTAKDFYPNINNAEFRLSLRVYFNTITRNPLFDSGTIVRGVAELKIHEGYLPFSSGQFMQNDVALVKLDKAVLTIPTIRLASVANLFASQPATIYGFGVNRKPETSSATLSDTLLEGSLTVLSPEQCTAVFAAYNFRVNDKQHLCARGPQPPCWGDLGSPLMVAGLQVATTSFTFDGCDPNYPAVFTRVHYFYEWIKANTNLL